MTDTYTKIILTVIASCLLVIVVRQASPSADAVRAGMRRKPSGAVPRPANTVSAWEVVGAASLVTGDASTRSGNSPMTF
jgi:hypothetical protein